MCNRKSEEIKNTEEEVSISINNNNNGFRVRVSKFSASLVNFPGVPYDDHYSHKAEHKYSTKGIKKLGIGDGLNL